MFDAIAGRFMISGWFASADYVAKHRAETLELVAQFTGLDPATVAGMVRPTYPAALDPRDTPK